LAEGTSLCTTSAFVQKFDPTLSGPASLVYSTYLGGTTNRFDFGNAIAVDHAGNAYVTGFTTSANFPVTSGAFQPQYADSSQSLVVCNAGACGDAFVTVLNSSGTEAIYSSYLGGAGTDAGYGIAPDAAGEAFVVGSSCSYEPVSGQPTSPLFPITTGAYLATPSRSCNGFVTKVSADGSRLLFSTYFGTPNSASIAHVPYASAVTVDPAGNALVVGNAAAPDINNPAPIRCNTASCYSFFAIFDPTGHAQFSASLPGAAVSLGTVGQGGGYGITSVVSDVEGNAYITGSATFYLRTTQSLGSYTGNPFGAFVAKFSGIAPPPTTTTLASSPTTPIYGNLITLTATVVSNTGTPAGTVEFTDNGNPLGSSTLDTSGVATLTTSQLSAGPHTLAANYTGATGFPASSGSTAVTVVPAVLSVVAANATRHYGAANPAFSYSISGFVNEETQATAVTGAPLETTTATDTSSTGNYPIVVSSGTLSAANYTFSFTGGTLTITRADVIVTLTSSNLNPVYGTPVTFTAKVTSTTSGVPAGRVVFGGLIGQDTAAPLSENGTAVLTTAPTTLLIGAQTVQAIYQDTSDSNFNSGFASILETVSGTGTPFVSLKVSLSRSVLRFGPTRILEVFLTLTNTGNVEVTSASAVTATLGSGQPMALPPPVVVFGRGSTGIVVMFPASAVAAGTTSAPFKISGTYVAGPLSGNWAATFRSVAIPQ
jgi:hypothetical protein